MARIGREGASARGSRDRVAREGDLAWKRRCFITRERDLAPGHRVRVTREAVVQQVRPFRVACEGDFGLETRDHNASFAHLRGFERLRFACSPSDARRAGGGVETRRAVAHATREPGSTLARSEGIVQMPPFSKRRYAY